MISIIVPVFNKEKYIIAAIEAIMAQSFIDWELLLVDDGSTDKSIQLIKDFLSKEPETVQGKFRIISSEKNEGVAKARNIGLDNAEGRYISFLDADDIWIKDKLKKQMKFMEEKEAAFVFTAYEFGDEQARGIGKIVSVPSTLSYHEALSRTIIFTSTTLFDLTKIDKEMLKMPKVKSEDTATWWKILRHGYVAHGLNEVTTIYRRSPYTLSSNKLEGIKRIWNLYRNVEKLSLVYSIYNFIPWAIRATLRRL